MKLKIHCILTLAGVVATVFCGIAAWKSWQAAIIANQISERSLEYRRDRDSAEDAKRIRPFLRFTKPYGVFHIATDADPDKRLLGVIERPPKDRQPLALRNYGKGHAMSCQLEWTVHDLTSLELLEENAKSGLPVEHVQSSEQIYLKVIPRILISRSRLKGEIRVYCMDINGARVCTVYGFASYYEKGKGGSILTLHISEIPRVNWTFDRVF